MSTKIKNQIDKIVEDCQKLNSLVEMLDWDIQSTIYLYLRTHGELSLSQLANSIGKSKTTIKRHIGPMVEANLVSERAFKKAYYYKLDRGLLNINIPYRKFIEGDNSKKEEFENLLNQMDQSQLETINQAGFSTVQIVLKILRNTLEEAFNYVDLYSNMPASKTSIMDFSKMLNMTFAFTVLNPSNRAIFDKHWEQFMENYVADIYKHIEDPHNEALPNFDSIEIQDIAWHLIFPINRMFKVK